MDPMEDPDDILRANRTRERQFMFDVAFDGSSSQVRHRKIDDLWNSALGVCAVRAYRVRRVKQGCF